MKHGKHCVVCEKEYWTDTDDVWVQDGDRLICGECYVRVMDKLCDQMEAKERNRDLMGRYIYEAFNGDYGTV